MDTTRHRLAAVLLSAALVPLAGCGPDGRPVGPAEPETSLAEAAFDLAADATDTRQDDHFARSDRQRDRDRDHAGFRTDRVALVVTFGRSSVELAAAVLEREGADDRQQALLREAVELQRAAEAALEAGDGTLAVRKARRACWTALKAWVLPGGVTREEAEAVLALAEDLLRAAVESVGEDEGVRGLVLEWATTFYVSGAASLEAGQIRGVAALWKAAVLAYTLVG